MTQEITYHERAGYKVQALMTKEREMAAYREQEEAKAAKIVTEDINSQVVSLNNQLRTLQAQEQKQQAIETQLEQAHAETI